MTPQQLKQQLQQTLQLPEDKIDSLMESMTETIKDYVKDLDEVAIPGFGTFAPVKYDEQISVDSESGEMKLLPPSVVVEFKPSVVVRKKFIG